MNERKGKNRKETGKKNRSTDSESGSSVTLARDRFPLGHGGGPTPPRGGNPAHPRGGVPSTHGGVSQAPTGGGPTRPTVPPFFSEIKLPENKYTMSDYKPPI